MGIGRSFCRGVRKGSLSVEKDLGRGGMAGMGRALLGPSIDALTAGSDVSVGLGGGGGCLDDFLLSSVDLLESRPPLDLSGPDSYVLTLSRLR